MATSNNALISVRQLTKEFRRGVVALDHCDLDKSKRAFLKKECLES